MQEKEERKTYTSIISGLKRFKRFDSQSRSFLKEKLNIVKGKKKVKIQFDSNGLCAGFGYIYFDSLHDRNDACLISFEPYPWSLSPCPDKRIAQAFPQLLFEQRMQLKIDQESYYSLTPGYVAQDMIQASLAVFTEDVESPKVCVDCTAGSGGNTLAIIQSKVFDQVVAIEIDTLRANDLAHNLKVAHPNNQNWSVECADSIEWILKDENSIFDLVFFDPPWGGPNYSSNKDTPSDYSLGPNCPSLVSLLSETFTFGKAKGRVKVAAIKLPSNFDCTSLVDLVTAPGPWSSLNGLDERPHPFHLSMGTRISFLVIAYPPFARNSDLNGMVANLKALDLECGNALKPRYWDWEKKTWISVKRFMGCFGKQAVKPVKEE